MTWNPVKAGAQGPSDPPLIGKLRIHDHTHQNHVSGNPGEASWDLNLGPQSDIPSAQPTSTSTLLNCKKLYLTLSPTLILLSGSPSLNTITNLSSSNSSTMCTTLINKITAGSTILYNSHFKNYQISQNSKKFKLSTSLIYFLFISRLNKTDNTV